MKAPVGIIHSYYYMAFKENERLEKIQKEEEARQQEKERNKGKDNGPKRRVHPAQAARAQAMMPQALTELAAELDEEGGL